MISRSAYLGVLGGVALLFAPSLARADEAPPEPLPPPVEAPAEPAPLPVAHAHDEDAAVRRALLAYGHQARRARIAGGVGVAIGGAATAAAGIYYRTHYDDGVGTTIWVTGAVVGALGLVELLRPAAFEAFASEAQALSPSQIRARWASMADAAERGRHIGGTFSLVVGAAAIATGAAFAAGAADFDRAERTAWTVTLLSIGGAVAAGGLTSLLVESNVETGYKATYGDDAVLQNVSFGVAPTTQGGAMAGFRASF